MDAAHSDTHDHSDADINTISVAYDSTLVSIQRPWLEFDVLSLPYWDMEGAYTVGGISAGADGDNTNSAWPLLPVAFVAIKNLAISANWGHQDSDKISRATKVGGSVGYGPFKLSGNYSRGHSEAPSMHGLTAGP